MSVEIDNFNTGTASEITNKTAPRSISPTIVGGRFTLLANILEAFNTSRIGDISGVNSAISDLIADISALELANTGDETAQTIMNKIGDGSKISATYLPAYVDDVLEFPNLAAFPATGESGKIYIAINDATPANPTRQYRWSGSIYSVIAASVGTTDDVVEGANNKYWTNARTLSSVLTGYVKATVGRVLAAGDSLLTAIGILEHRISVNEIYIGGNVNQLTTTNKTNLIQAINEINAKGGGNFTLAGFNALTAAQRHTQGTVADTAANLSTAPALATVFPAGWLIITTDGTPTYRMADGERALSALEYGVESDLIDKFNHAVVENTKITLASPTYSDWARVMNVWGTWNGGMGGKVISEPLLVKFQDTNGQAMVSGVTQYTWHFFEEEEEVESIAFYMRTQGVYTATPDRNKVVIQSVDPITGITKQIGISADTPDMFKTAVLNMVVVPLITPVVCPRGWYLIGVRWEATATTTAPSIASKAWSSSNQNFAFGSAGPKGHLTNGSSTPFGDATVGQNFWEMGYGGGAMHWTVPLRVINAE